MRIDVVTIFPELFGPFFDTGMVRLAREKKILTARAHDLRAWTFDKHHQVDDVPYGGGPGMVMKPEPFYRALKSLLGHEPCLLSGGERSLLLTPQGRRFSQSSAAALARAEHLVILCGRYEGVDERVRGYVSDEISLGDFVVSGGEVGAMAVIDAVSRLLKGVLGKEESLEEESFSTGFLEYPQYTRPAKFQGAAVPPVLLSGNHSDIAEWRRRQAELRTAARRPDLL